MKQQRGVLAAYRDRLAAGWRQTGLVSAAEALRAVQFAAASDQAAGQMDAQEQAAAQLLAAQQAQLAELALRRRRLAALAQEAARAAATNVEKTLERNTTTNPAMTRR
jgi:hypothetical protein